MCLNIYVNCLQTQTELETNSHALVHVNYARIKRVGATRYYTLVLLFETKPINEYKTHCYNSEMTVNNSYK